MPYASVRLGRVSYTYVKSVFTNRPWLGRIFSIPVLTARLHVLLHAADCE